MTAEERLIDMTGGDAEPLLSPEAYADCLLVASVPDSEGRYLCDADYEPTYDFHRAASEVWRRKASRVAADYTISIEGRELNRAQMVENFLKMSARELSMAQPRYMAPPGTVETWRI